MTYLRGSKSPLHVFRWPRVEKVDKTTDLIYSVTNSTGATQSFYSNHKTSTEQKDWSSLNSQSDLTLICDWSERNQLRLFCSELVLWLAEKSWLAPLSSLHSNYSKQLCFPVLLRPSPLTDHGSSRIHA